MVDLPWSLAFGQKLNRDRRCIQSPHMGGSVAARYPSSRHMPGRWLDRAQINDKHSERIGRWTPRIQVASWSARLTAARLLIDGRMGTAVQARPSGGRPCRAAARSRAAEAERKTSSSPLPRARRGLRQRAWARMAPVAARQAAVRAWPAARAAQSKSSPRSNRSTTASRSRSRAWRRRAAGRRPVPLHGRLGHQDPGTTICSRCPTSISGTRCASRSASSARSSRGTSRCSWRPGSRPRAGDRLHVVLKPAEQTPLSASGWAT